jgi:cell division protein FtsI/penicillin-binding protein 2
MNKKLLDLIYFHRFNVLLLLIIFSSVIFNIVLYYTTHFEKTITIKDKYTRYRRHGSNYNIVDENNNVYQVDNVWFKLNFDRAERYNKLEKGKKYKIEGYGIRLPMIDIYKNIYQVD